MFTVLQRTERPQTIQDVMGIADRMKMVEDLQAGKYGQVGTVDAKLKGEAFIKLNSGEGYDHPSLSAGDILMEVAGSEVLFHLCLNQGWGLYVQSNPLPKGSVYIRGTGK